MEFLIGATASMGAVCFTNPLEVIKTRMQLQGELKAKGQHAVHYKNIFHAGYTIVKNDGILALQSGLTPALAVQLILNGTRLGAFQMAEKRGHIKDSQGNIKFFKVVIFGGLSGGLGQFLASPFFLLKTHLQSRAASSIAVGHQHDHKGLWKGLRNIYEKHGISGLYRGATFSVPRAFMGSTTQLSSFEYVKQHLQKYEFFQVNPPLTSFVASMVSGLVISIVMTPFDLVMIRNYNQPTDAKGKGLLYTSYTDCVLKIYRTENVSAFYKGFGPMYFRLGPHTVISLVLWDQLKNLHERFRQRNTAIPT